MVYRRERRICCEFLLFCIVMSFTSVTRDCCRKAFGIMVWFYFVSYNIALECCLAPQSRSQSTDSLSMSGSFQDIVPADNLINFQLLKSFLCVHMNKEYLISILTIGMYPQRLVKFIMFVCGWAHDLNNKQTFICFLFPLSRNQSQREEKT